ncbi:MAG: hypothetical protein OXN95_05640 [bacterium]|nr:hypothetical protein [bacterium]
MTLKSTCEEATDRTNGKSFNLPRTASAMSELPEMEPIQTGLIELMTLSNDALATHVFRGLIRQAFFIELVNDEVTTTHYTVRWDHRLQQDPRYADDTKCLDVLGHTTDLLLTYIKHHESKELLDSFKSHPMVSHELPLDYIDTDLSSIHQPDNICVIPIEIAAPIAISRRTLLAKENPHKAVFDQLYKKLKVKSYLTDRALTGTDKTNREKRWETHPDNIQFATRGNCMTVELALVRQLVHFKNFPHEFKDQLIEERVVDSEERYTTCPITGSTRRSWVVGFGFL